MTLVDKLEAGRARVERGWCKSVDAKDESGASVPPESVFACSWCARGATFLDPEVRRALDHQMPRTYKNLTVFNDAQKSVVPILALFDRAIAWARIQEARV